jgi:hypothetical protein
MGNDFIYGLLVHLGSNMWNNALDYLRFDEGVWYEITEKMGRVGANMVVIDIGEGLLYPSHPELAVKGSWTPEKMQKELKRLRSLGIEPIPKLNFSACHDLWLKDYARMVSTDEYYRVVADLIKDVADIFDRPRFFHLGWDEEKEKTQRRLDYMVMRQGDLWWHDMIYTAKEAERHGARGWIWSDKEWKHKDEFMARCPRSIVQSHWYYSAGFGPKWEKRDDKKMNAAPWAEPYTLCAFKELDEGGFDQIACGSNIYTPVNFPNVVKHCLKNVSRKRLLGFLNAPWGAIVRDDNPKKGGSARYLDAVDQLAAARKEVESV